MRTADYVYVIATDDDSLNGKKGDMSYRILRGKASEGKRERERKRDN